MRTTSRTFLASLALGVAALFVGPSTSDAKTHFNPDVKIAFEVPDNWTAEHRDGVLTAEAPNGQVHVIMQGMRGAENLRSAVDGVDDALSESFRHVKNIGECEERDLHGLKATEVKGKAMLGDEPIRWTAIVVERGHHYMLIVAFGTEEGLEKCLEDAKVIVESIRPRSDD